MEMMCRDRAASPSEGIVSKHPSGPMAAYQTSFQSGSAIGDRPKAWPK